MILLWLSLRPKTDADRQKLSGALSTLLAEYSAFGVKTDEEGTVKIGFASEEQLEGALDRLARTFGVQAVVTRIDIAYKEALTVSASGEAKYVDRSAGRGQYAHVKIRVAPGERGSGFVFRRVIAGGAIPQAFVKPIEEGIHEAAERGILAGYPIEDVHATLYDGSYHEQDSSADAFRIAAAQAFRDAAKRAQPVLLEPIMRVTLIVPAGDGSHARAMLSARRGVLFKDPLQSTAWAAPVWATFTALVPLSETFGLQAELRRCTTGRGICSIRFAHYAPAAHADDDGDRDATVTWPKNPRTPPHVLHASVPEPAPDFSE